MIRQDVWCGLRRSAIVDQQLWYLGRDIASPGGNALLRYGFERRRPSGETGSTAYLLPLDRDVSNSDGRPGGVLVCWGFAIYAGAVLAGCGADEAPCTGDAHASMAGWAGAFIERFRDTPGLVRRPLTTSVHQVAELPPAAPPSTAAERGFASRTIQRIALALAAYERWAIDTLGDAHRSAALRDAPRHKRHRFSRAPELSHAWEQLAAMSDRSDGVSHAHAERHDLTGDSIW